MVVGVPFPKMVIRDRSLNRQTSDYTHAQIPYIKRLTFPHFLRSIRFCRVVMLQTLFAISVSVAKPDPFGSTNRFKEPIHRLLKSSRCDVSIQFFSNNSGSFYIGETFK